MSPLAFPSPPSLFPSLSVFSHNGEAQPLPRGKVIQDDGSSSLRLSAEAVTEEGSFLLHPKGTQHREQREEQQLPCVKSQGLYPLLWCYRGKPSAARTKVNIKKGSQRLFLMSCNSINYCLHGWAPLYILSQAFHICFILNKKHPENTKTFKNPHPDSNIVQDVKHSCAKNHMQAIRIFF